MIADPGATSETRDLQTHYPANSGERQSHSAEVVRLVRRAPPRYRSGSSWREPTMRACALLLLAAVAVPQSTGCSPCRCGGGVRDSNLPPRETLKHEDPPPEALP